MPQPDSKPRPPEDFSRFLATKDPLLVVGGQAINLWALYYEGVTKDLAPFVSRDVDLLGDRKVLKEIAELTGMSVSLASRHLKLAYDLGFLEVRKVGYIAPEDGADGLVVIEVLRWVNGVSEDELLKDSVIMGVGVNGVPVKVPSPVYLLQAKLANLATINQKGRQDGRHVMILFRLIPSYLNELIESVHKEVRTERDVVNIFGTLLEIVTSDKNLKIFNSMRLDPRSLFSDLPTKGFPKIAAFKKHQLKRAFN